MNKNKIVGALLSVFFTMPIWFYLLYQILIRVEATELMFFLYWVYVPICFLAVILLKLAED